ncbi:limonene-1,2-epoxide hydrolase family protein [Actinospongicola halichondriae]|uniref:limonene-1,2-epoxide hydrolase family protein n=1 Tax=Actinospongicola halichondriae TaxID=3236844 RepID=UPI003D534ABF
MADQSPETVVRAFLEALERLDTVAACDLVSDDILYVNKGLPAVRGRAQFERAMGFLGKYCDDFEGRINHLAVEGDIVLTERVDLIGRGGFRPEFWVCGTFEVREGRIVLWRDHFDFVNVTLACVRSAMTMGLRRLTS